MPDINLCAYSKEDLSGFAGGLQSDRSRESQRKSTGRTTFKSHAQQTAESKASIEFDRIYKSEECALPAILYDIKFVLDNSL
jgi:hypothetical protein